MACLPEERVRCTEAKKNFVVVSSIYSLWSPFSQEQQTTTAFTPVRENCACDGHYSIVLVLEGTVLDPTSPSTLSCSVRSEGEISFSFVKIAYRGSKSKAREKTRRRRARQASDKQQHVDWSPQPCVHRCSVWLRSGCALVALWLRRIINTPIIFDALALLFASFLV